jgi:hypothetical protein
VDIFDEEAFQFDGAIARGHLQVSKSVPGKARFPGFDAFAFEDIGIDLPLIISFFGDIANLDLTSSFSSDLNRRPTRHCFR